MNVDQAGIDFIKSVEGFRGLPYQDRSGTWTIGYGHTEFVTPTTFEITQAEAEEVLTKDLGLVEKTIRDHLKIELAQCEHNAVASFVFNVGALEFAQSTLLKKLNNGDKIGASKEFTRWDFCTDLTTKKKVQDKGLLSRRMKERELFLGDIELKRAQIG